MVVFTCNGCGESLRKPQVEKHYKFQCRRCEVLSCIDCGKDFPGDTYLSHTSCISEAEKYQGADYKPKPGANKGMHKQNNWVATVQTAVERARANGVSRPAIELLEKIQSFDNVPQKEAKFVNFVKSAANIRNPNIASEAFQQLRAAFTASKEEKVTVKEETPVIPALPPAKAEPVTEIKQEEGAIASGDSESADEIKPKKRKFDFITETASYMRKRQKTDGVQLDVLERKMYKVYKKSAAADADTEQSAAEPIVLLDADKFNRKLGRKLRNSDQFTVTDELLVSFNDDADADNNTGANGPHVHGDAAESEE